MTDLSFRTTACCGFTQVKLTFDGPYRVHPLELVVPIAECPNIKKDKVKKELKRPFTFTTAPFPFDLDDYPATHESWCKLTSNVHDWLEKTSGENTTDEWRWAVNFFWICYIGSSPRISATTSWNPDIIPLSGEFVNRRSMQMALGQHVPRERGAELIVRLVEWMKLREKWIVEGVDIEEYQRRVSSQEFL